MKKLCLCLALLATAAPCLAGPRDATAVLNRCGKPLKGDETVLDNSVAGGHRVLNYERGILHFDKVAMDGWTFTYGTRKTQEHRDATQMAELMPCLRLALADSASPEPIRPVSETERLATSARDSLKQILLFGVLGIAVIGIILFLLSRRSDADEPE